jgi:hypothetical protein
VHLIFFSLRLRFPVDRVLGTICGHSWATSYFLYLCSVSNACAYYTVLNDRQRENTIPMGQIDIHTCIQSYPFYPLVSLYYDLDFVFKYLSCEQPPSCPLFCQQTKYSLKELNRQQVREKNTKNKGKNTKFHEKHTRKYKIVKNTKFGSFFPSSKTYMYLSLAEA